MNPARRAKLYTARVLIEHAKEIIAKAMSEERGNKNWKGLQEAERNLAAAVAALNAIGVDPVGEFERQAGGLLSKTPDAE